MGGSRDELLLADHLAALTAHVGGVLAVVDHCIGFEGSERILEVSTSEAVLWQLYHVAS